MINLMRQWGRLLMNFCFLIFLISKTLEIAEFERGKKDYIRGDCPVNIQ